IFGGSEASRAMGQAEVALTINNDSGVLPIDYTEVTVMRRANRGGEGEFFLNDTVCRLRDIQMLFLGTGLGGRSYSLIGQGQVDSVLNAGPEERRQLLEEAAGLARYKRRRREAERRLLQLVEDLSGRESPMQVLQERLRATTGQRERLAQDLQRLQGQHAQMDEVLGTLREQAETLASRRDDLLEQLRTTEDAHAAAVRTHAEAEDRVGALRVEVTDLDRAQSRAQHDLARLDARLAALTDQLGGIDAREAALAHTAAQLQATAGERASTLAALQEQHESIQTRLAQFRSKCADIDANHAAVEEQVRQLAAERA